MLDPPLELAKHCVQLLSDNNRGLYRENTRIRKFTKLLPNAFFDTTGCLVLYLFSNKLKSLVSWYAESTYVRAKHNELWLKSIQ